MQISKWKLKESGIRETYSWTLEVMVGQHVHLLYFIKQ